MQDGNLTLAEPAARQLVLVRAIEDVDTHGRLLSVVERDEIEREALAASRRTSGGGVDAAQYLHQRAQRATQPVGRVRRLRRQPHRQRMGHRIGAARLQHFALAAHHVLVQRHHAGGPRGGRVQPLQVRLRGQHAVVLQLVRHHHAGPAVDLPPARGAAEAGDAQALGEMLVRVPVLEVGAVRRLDFPPHGKGCLAKQCHVYLLPRMRASSAVTCW